MFETTKEHKCAQLIDNNIDFYPFELIYFEW